MSLNNQNFEKNIKENKKWWLTWTPVWDLMENRHMSTYVTDEIIDKIINPVLIIGAGQGLIVKYLMDKGYNVTGVDLEDEMIKYADLRHSIKLVKADARNLPFEDDSFNTVIISSGVVDYIYDDITIKEILNESLRVLTIHGNVFTAFYQIDKKLEKIYKKLGVIDPSGVLMHSRIFKIEEYVKTDPLLAVKPIMEWTKKGFLQVIIYWTILGLTRPAALYEEQKKMEKVIEKTKELKIDVQELFNSIPDKVPYREINDIKNLFTRINCFYNSIDRYNDCVIVRLHKSGNNMDINDKEKKKWLLKTENLTKKYKKSKINAVDSINFFVNKGIIFGLLGPNGAGKTTTISMLCGLLKPTSGKIIIKNKKSIKTFQKKIGYIPQEIALYPVLTAKENLIFFGKLYKVNKSELNVRIDELLEITGLSNRKNDLVKNFSTGMKRRLNLAVGLINDPDLLLMDEPTVGIDPQSRNCIFEAILKLKKQGKTIIYSTHYMEEADRLCDHIAIIDNGRIILEGNPKQLVKKNGFNHFIFQINNKLSDKNNELIKSLKSIKKVFQVEKNNNNIKITALATYDNFDILEEIKKLTDSLDTNISLIKINESNLETLFLDITGRQLRDVPV